SAASSHASFEPGRRCRNCGALAEQAHCPVCGQVTTLHPPSVGEFLHEFLGHYVAFEGPLWRTLAALLLTPGRLTVEYFAGRRQRYIPPLRLYLTVSLILFAVSGMQGEGLKMGNESIEFRMPKGTDTGPVIAARVDPQRFKGTGFFDRKISKLVAMTDAQRTERINTAVRMYVPYVLIVLVPVLALLLKLIYWKRGLLYGEHLVVAFHAQTVAFVFAIVSALPLGETFGSLWIIVLVVHGTIALRRVYGGGWIPTALREAVLLFVYSAVVALSVSVLVGLALLF
ncbi:MAG: DUF3667 domain-containing protein, partial [Burkholderiaceae bacterium]